MKTFFLALFGALIGAITVILYQHYSFNPFIEYYDIENSVVVSPHGLRKNIETGKNEAIIVDLRSAEEYREAHIKGAINIPAYRDKDHNAYDQVDRIVSSFRALPKEKEIIVYCYSIPCMTGRKVGKMLAHEGINVKHLGIGWNEWRYDWNSWNHPHEWDITNPLDYIEGTTITHTGGDVSSSSGKYFDISPCSLDTYTGC